MFESFRAWRAERKRRRQELDRELAAEAAAFAEDPAELSAQLDEAEAAARINPTLGWSPPPRR